MVLVSFVCLILVIQLNRISHEIILIHSSAKALVQALLAAEGLIRRLHTSMHFLAGEGQAPRLKLTFNLFASLLLIVSMHKCVHLLIVA